VVVELPCTAEMPGPRYHSRRENHTWDKIWICRGGWHGNECTIGRRIYSKFVAQVGSVPGTWGIKLCSAL